MNLLKSTLAASMMLGCLSMTARAQNLILNGDFESPAITTNSIAAGTPTSWAYPGPEGLLFNGDGGNNTVWPLPQHGAQYAYIGNDFYGPPLTHTFTVSNLVEGGYALVWHDSSGHSGSANTSIYGARLVKNPGTEVFSQLFNAYHATLGAWVQRSNSFALTPGTYTLSFQPNGTVGGLGTLIDNVSVKAVNPDLVPDAHLAASICWHGKTNCTYQLQYVTNAASTNWVNLGAPVPGAGTNCFDDILGPGKRYYRLTRIP